MMNMHLMGIPVVGVGSQPEEDENLNYLEMPTGMATFRQAILPEQDDLADYPHVHTLLQQVQNLLDAGAGHLDLNASAVAERRLLNQILSDGEVSVLFDTRNGGHIEVQETSLPGVWWHRTLDANQTCVDETLEVGTIPQLVQQTTFANAAANFALPDVNTLPAGTINAPGLLAELHAAVSQQQFGHVINLSLLPLSPEDLAFITACLGVGKTAILSRGYGNCRITATAIQNVWWVQYFNSTDTLILNTLEVVDVPLVACASAEDLADSRERLQEIREALL